MFDLQVLSENNDVVYVHRLEERPCQVGRAPVNDLTINNTMLSQFHAILWIEGGQAHVRDLGSRNGTFVNGSRAEGTVTLSPGDVMSFGPDTRVRIAKVDGRFEAPPTLVVQDQDSGLCWVIRGDRMHFGGTPECEIQVGDGPRLATLLVTGPDEIWLGEESDDRPLTMGESFAVGDQTFAVNPGASLLEVTAAPARPAATSSYPYVLTVTLDGPMGPQATLEDVMGGLSYKVEAENRAVLLYILARQWLEDDSKLDVDRGWCSNEDLLTGVWGRSAQDDNKLHVLVYRLRNELKKVGFEPWFLEKRRRYTRLRLQNAVIG